MAKTSTPVDERLFSFLATKTTQEDDFLRDLRAAAAAAGLPEIHISFEQATWLKLMMQCLNARKVVEVGTLGGYSAIAMARGMAADGRVVTHEIEPKHAEFAREWIARSDQKGKVEVRVGAASETLGELPDGAFDAVFLDADKTGYVDYLRHAIRLLRPGGALFADNVLASGRIADGTAEKEVALRAFLDAALAAPQLEGLVVPVGDGIWFGVKNA
ncbi:MAG: O-methyltransferase [Planctomycetes bacterium]|nr:O-methyltransferase [Planctomycetota bacterium]